MRPVWILFVAALAATVAPRPSAQCVPFGLGCTPQHQINCGTAPHIGTTFLLCAFPACSSNQGLMLFGACAPQSIPISSGVACSFCPRCFLDVSPIFATIFWPGMFCLGVGIPRDNSLIGTALCVQDVCAFGRPPNCVCLSNAIQVRIVR